MLTASDIMRKDVTTVPPDMTVEEVGRLFIERNESGFPVVDGEGNLLGIVTENDLLNRNKKLHIPTVLRAAVVVSEICTPEPVTVAEDAPIEEIATVMAEQKLHHLPVLRDKKLVGMVDQHDVIKGISGGGRQDPDS
jgi:CBS domain-containing protein